MAAAKAETASQGGLVISLDYELYWGMRDVVSEDAFQAAADGVRVAIPGMLDLFRTHGIHATWATVGFLAFEGKAALEAALPEKQPSYTIPTLTNYRHFERVSDTGPERTLYFGGDLVDRIAATPHQEMGSHTFSHYYTTETGQTAEEFAADLDAADMLWRSKGLAMRSIVFPRNQMNPDYLPLCAARGITVFRGNQHSIFHDTDHPKFKSTPFRIVRLLDGMLNVTGRHLAEVEHIEADGVCFTNVPASRYLRPCGARIGVMDRARIARIRADMKAAAKTGKLYHLWWHPHNFGAHPETNLELLGLILKEYTALRDSHGFASLTMAEAADR